MQAPVLTYPKLEWPRFEAIATQFRSLTGRPMATYVGGPFSGHSREEVEAHIRNAENWGVWISSIGAYPVIPHANTQDPRFEHTQLYEFWIKSTMWLMLQCDALLLIPGWRNSRGATGEHALFEQLPQDKLLFDADREEKKLILEP